MTSLASTSGDGLDSWERLFDDVDLTKCGGTGLGIKYGEASKVRQANAILSTLKPHFHIHTPLLSQPLLRSIHLHTHTHNTQPDVQHNTTRPRSRP
jgi:hypothetical protein